MAFLFSPKAQPFFDESLESYLLRIVSENFFDSYEQLSLAIREELHELDYDAHGAFPIDLKRLNVYHAKHNSHFRMRAVSLIEKLLELPPTELQKLALLKSDRKYNGAAAVYRDGADIPLSFIRYNGEDGKGSIPVCPHCLAEEPYIKQSWHLKWVNVCIKHNCSLISKCPECSSLINYIENESITHCTCGFELSKATTSTKYEKDAELLKQLLSDEASEQHLLFQTRCLHQKFSALLWYQKRYSKQDVFCLSDVVEFFDQWPTNIYEELNHLTVNAEIKLLDLFNRTSFNFIYGELLTSLPYQANDAPHFIQSTLFVYLKNLVELNPKSKKANVADMLVSISETALLLGTTYDQVYRLYQDGILRCAFRATLHQRINPRVGIFFLREVIEYKSSFGERSPRMYLSIW